MDQAPLELFNAQAQDAGPMGIMRPSQDELAELLQGWSGPRPLRVCSGGTSSMAAAHNQWTLDLRPQLNRMAWQSSDHSVWVGGGCRMGDVRQALLPHGQAIATGLSGLPGLGYVLTGGMGPRSRALGLAIDHLLEIRGVWGNGEEFWLQRDRHADSEQWRALCGAAPFLAVVTEVRLLTHPLIPLWVEQCRAPSDELPDWIKEAEASDSSISLQWHWGDADQLDILRVYDQDPGRRGMQCIDGLHQLPALVVPRPGAQRVHFEVVGLLGPARAADWNECMPLLRDCMRRRPHPSCSLSCQQLGGATSLVSAGLTSFHHRDAVWKPWITAGWGAGDLAMRQRSLRWLEELWSVMQPLCPGIHLAQLHDHLPFHQRELEQAFGKSLPGLKALKKKVDPAGNLPPL